MYCVPVLVWFATSKAGKDISYNRLCLTVASRVDKQVKTWFYESSKSQENFNTGCRNGLVPSLSCRNDFLAIAIKN